MRKLLLLYTLFCVLGLHAQTSKLSPYVRQAMMTSSACAMRNNAKARTNNDVKQPTITAFVCTADTDVLRQQGCRIYAQWSLTPSPSPTGEGSICIASIPLDKLDTLADMPQIQRIEAGESCGITNDTTAIVTRTKEAWNIEGAQNSLPLGGLKGTGVVVGLVDIGFDLTHPTFYSADGQTYRVKQLWDQLDRTEGGEAVTGKDTVYVGRQYKGQEALLALQHSYDGLTQTHGTHTTGTAAGSGWEGSLNSNLSTLNTYSGMAPDADICLVCNATSDNADMIPKDELYKYTTATDMLAFKYIFDYAKSVGKPCVINFSEGGHDDLYQSGIYSDVLSKMIGPGRILCSSAGNEANGAGRYVHKAVGETGKGAFLVKSSSNTAIYVLRSEKPVQMRLSFYKDSEKALDKDYDLTDLANYPDSVMMDSLDINGDTIVVMLQTYPSCFDETLYATDFILRDLSDSSYGYSIPTSMTLKGEDNDIEALCGGGFFVSNSLDPSLDDFDSTHSILFPSSAKDVISVGATSYVTGYKDYQGKDIGVDYGTDGVRAAYCSIGPAFNGCIKPDIMAPGTNIISAYNSFWRENNPGNSRSSGDVKHTEFNGRTYPWGLSTGTSMSSPVVTGIVALWLQVCPTLTPDQIRDVFAHTSTHYDESLDYPNNEYGYGQIDAMAGVEYIQQTYTGIREIENGEEKIENGELKIENADAIYTLEGCKVSTAGNQHGLFIVVKDGKARKVVCR